MKSMQSVTTSLIGADPAKRAQNTIGTPHGEVGSGVVPRKSVMASDPVETERNMVQQLPPQIGLYIAADGNTASLETRWGMYGVPARSVLMEAAAVTAGAMGQPASDTMLDKALAGLRTVTASRAVADDDLDLANEILKAELKGYPADVAMAAIRAAGRQSTFMPSLSDLIELCNARMGRRRRIHTLIMRTLENSQGN